MNAVNTLDPSEFEQKAPDDWSRKEMLKSISALRDLKKQDFIQKKVDEVLQQQE